MKLVLALIFALLTPVAAFAADSDAQVTAAAKSWLALVDTNNYAQSWSTASKILQTHVTAAQWETAGKATRDPLGAVVSRDVSGVDYAKTLPGVPDGSYALVHFNTHFANKAAAVENVTLTLQDGMWKTAGYYIK